MSIGLFNSAASKSPTILSASLTADISGVVTTIALSAPAMAFLNPCSIPAVVTLLFQGGHGGYGAPIAREIFAEYFKLELEGDDTIEVEGSTDEEIEAVE